MATIIEAVLGVVLALALFACHSQLSKMFKNNLLR